MVLGSEGRLGVITEATVHVRRVPAERGRSSATCSRPGRRASPPCATSPRARRRPSVTRVSDAYETRVLVRHAQGPDAARPRSSRTALQTYLAAPARLRRRRDVPVVHRLRGHGAPRRRAAQARRADRRAATAGCASAPRPASSTTRRSSTPPTSATSCSTAARSPTCRRPRRRGAALRPLYDAVMAAARGAFDELGVRGYIMCHLSHSYHAGACLYFTFAFKPAAGRRRRSSSTTRVKSAIQQAFVDNGATLSHHHAVGTEHARVARAGHLGAGRRDAAGAVRRRRPGREPQPGEDRVTRDVVVGAQRGRPAPCASCCSARVFRPLIALYARRTVHGPRAPRRPRAARSLFVANHSSHMDTPLLLRALPRRWRRRTAVAAAADYFYGSALLAHVGLAGVQHRPRRARRGRRRPGASELRRSCSTTAGAWSSSPRARARATATVGRLRAGAAVLAAEHELAIVPVHVSGNARHDAGRPQLDAPRPAAAAPAPVARRASGRPIRPRTGEHRTDVMERVRRFFEAEGADTTPDKRAAARPRRLGRLTRWRASSSPAAAASSAARCARGSSRRGDEVRALARSPEAAATVAARGARAGRRRRARRGRARGGDGRAARSPTTSRASTPTAPRTLTS